MCAGGQVIGMALASHIDLPHIHFHVIFYISAIPEQHNMELKRKSNHAASITYELA